MVKGGINGSVTRETLQDTIVRMDRHQNSPGCVHLLAVYFLCFTFFVLLTLEHIKEP